MKKLTSLIIFMILASSVLFAQVNTKEQIKNKAGGSLTDVDPKAKLNPNATTFTDDLFDHQFDFPCGDATGEAGIETNGEYIYTSRWNGEGFFCYEMDGTFLGAFPVPGEAAVRDLAYDGTYFYGAAANTALFEMDFVGQSGTLISTLTAAVATRACAYDAEFDGFWGNNWSDPITLYDRTGGILNQFNCGAYTSYYGFAWLNDAGTPWLYGFAQSGGASQSVIVQIDPETGAETGITYNAIGFSTTGTGIAGGLAAFNTYAPGWWTLLGIIQNETIFGVEGGPSGPPPDLDLALTEIIEPNSGFVLCVEDVIIKVKNQGLITQSNIDVQYRVDGGDWVTETIPGPLVQNESIEYTFIQPYDFSAFGYYFIEGEVILEGDELPDNNFADKSIENLGQPDWHYYSITMYDDYGDGWNGGYVQIFGDNVEYINATLPSGAGPETIEFLVQGGAFLTAVWTSGGWPYECSYEIYNCQGELIFEDGMGGTEPTGGDIGYGGCGQPYLDAGITEIISPNNGINLGNEVVTVNIHNFGRLELIDIPVGFAVDNGTMIMEIAPGPISTGSSFEYTFNAMADLSQAGQHNIEVCTFLDFDEDPDNDCLEKSIYNSIQINEQTFDLSTGYQFISSFIIPPDPDMIVVMADILNENLDFVRNSQGQTLRKIGSNWVNGIGDWIIEEGYLVKMFSEDSFTIEEELVDPSTPVSVIEGYQFVSYFPENPMDALIAFETIIGDDLDFIRDSEGTMIRKIGPNWVNGIGDCQPGEGYLVKMFADTVLIYPGSSSFTCGNPFTDPRDEQVYNTVQIGEQCWMAENLNIGEMISGSSYQADNGIIEKFCYDDNPANCEVYGGLYQWNEMMEYTTTQGVQGICPAGWHLPIDDELTQLVDYVVSQGYPNVWDDPNGAVNALKSCRQVNSPMGGDCNTTEHPRWNENFTHHGFDAFGFSSLPGGGYNGSSFVNLGSNGYWWSSTETSSSTYAWIRLMSYDYGDVYRYYYYKTLGISVRCLRDYRLFYNLTILDNGRPNELSGQKHMNMIVSYFLFEGGNPAEAVYSLYIKGLEIGDEVVAFDGDKMVGATRIKSQNAFENELPVFSSLINGKGYEAGNPITLKVWSENNIIPFDFTMEAIYDSYVSDVYPEGDGKYSVVNITKGVIENVKESISIHPNPSKGIFNISLEGIIGDIQIKVLDLRGKEYSNFELNGSTSTQLDLSDLAAGVYFISFSGKDYNRVKKIVIQ